MLHLNFFLYMINNRSCPQLRIIMELQSYAISRGPNSLFSRLRKEGIDVRADVFI